MKAKLFISSVIVLGVACLAQSKSAYAVEYTALGACLPAGMTSGWSVSSVVYTPSTVPTDFARDSGDIGTSVFFTSAAHQAGTWDDSPSGTITITGPSSTSAQTVILSNATVLAEGCNDRIGKHPGNSASASAACFDISTSGATSLTNQQFSNPVQAAWTYYTVPANHTSFTITGTIGAHLVLSAP